VSNLVFGLRSGRLVCCGKWRRAVTPWGTRGAIPVISGPAVMSSGALTVAARAIRVGAEYRDIAVGAFLWTSMDGVFSLTNSTAASGGELYDNGNGEGTLIESVQDQYPAVCTAYVTDDATGA